jgi:DNA-binding NtrC family response regulator
MAPSVLIVDDEPSIRLALSRFLEREGYAPLTAGSLAEGRRVIASGKTVDAIVLDLRLPDGNGLDWIPELRDGSPPLAIVVVTGHGDIPLSVEAMRRGADHFLVKPVHPDELSVVLRKSLELQSLRRSTSSRERLETRPSPFWGSCPKMIVARGLAEKAARVESPVLLLGETGTGKGIVARWIHDQGERAPRPFVEVNCSALRGELLASELFGHVRGAFTSAVASRQGLLELADGGTLLLDEIGDMDVGIQSQFLNVLEQKRYRRVGESQERRSEFRLVTATNRSLESESNAGRFRSDLFFRIAVFPIELPPLRARPGDLVPLAQHLLATLGDPEREIRPEAFELMQSYDWPGNIRELRNVLERARILAGRASLAPEHFPGLDPASVAARRAPREDRGEPGREPVDERRIAEILRVAGGNKKKAARLLGISRATLYRRLGPK